MLAQPDGRIAAIALAVLLFDQFTKQIILATLRYGDERLVIPGFFKIVHWGNTGAAWSLFHGNNTLLTLVALAALVALVCFRRHFGKHLLPGQFALGLIFGGIVGNLVDRLVHDHVIDFLYFYMARADGGERGFPAFNVADSAICVGVGLTFLLTWRREVPREAPSPGPTT